MDRKWRTNRSALDTVQSYPEFEMAMPACDAEYTLATATDLYSVYTVLHIEAKASELRWSSQGRFYYFIAVQELPQEDEPAGPPPAPEGDEDPPEVVPIAEAGLDLGPQSHSVPTIQPPAASPPSAGTSGAAAPAAAAAAGTPAEDEDGRRSGGGEPPPRKTRTQILVPVSSACDHLTPELLQRLFNISLKGVQAQQLLLALVDSHGVVTRACLYNYIQAPLEGPGTANLELLDD